MALRIQEAASLRLDEIYRYTRDRWGTDQANRYITDLFAAFDRLLILIGRLLDFALRESGLDRFDHSAKAVDLIKVLETTVDHLLGQRLDVITASERIDRIYYAGLLRNDLLGAKGDERRLIAGQCEGLVVGVGMQRLCAAQHARQCLNGDTGDIVKRLLDR